jgi:hypothetical protein
MGWQRVGCQGSPGSRSPAESVDVNKRLDVTDGLLYSLLESMPVNSPQLPYRNWFAALRVQPMDGSIRIQANTRRAD